MRLSANWGYRHRLFGAFGMGRGLPIGLDRRGLDWGREDEKSLHDIGDESRFYTIKVLGRRRHQSHGFRWYLPPKYTKRRHNCSSVCFSAKQSLWGAEMRST